jgi:secondary thiamine-phosphate synthase enzyme
MQKISFRTTQRQELVNVAEEVQAVVTESGEKSGVCYVYCPHTTGGIVVNSYRDPNTPKDITHELDRLVPTRVDFFHINDTPSDAAAHVKSSLVGISQVFIIDQGRLVLGHSQGILFSEFDGPRDRHVFVKVVAG